VEYIIKDPEDYRGKNVVISGGGDSALDWAIFLAEGVAKKVTLIHRSQSFRAHPDSVQKAMDMAESGKIKMLLDAEVKSIGGNEKLSDIHITTKADGPVTLNADNWLIWTNPQTRSNSKLGTFD